MAPRRVDPIGKRFARLRTRIVDAGPRATVTRTLSRVKMYFVVADQSHKLMCRYYWEEGDLGGFWNDAFQMQMLEGNADETAPSPISSEIMGVEGGIVPKDFPDPHSAVEIDGFAAGGRTAASAGVVTASKDVFTVYVHDIDVEGPSPSFKLQFRGDPKDLVHRDLRGFLFQVGPKKAFGHDNSWIPRF
jgi:hypothetical protein